MRKRLEACESMDCGNEHHKAPTVFALADCSKLSLVGESTERSVAMKLVEKGSSIDKEKRTKTGEHLSKPRIRVNVRTHCGLW